MALSKKEIMLDEILKLSPIERIEIVEKILISFELPVRKEIDDLWSVEAEERIDNYEAGNIKTKSFGEVFKGIK